MQCWDLLWSWFAPQELPLVTIDGRNVRSLHSTSDRGFFPLPSTGKLTFPCPWQAEQISDQTIQDLNWNWSS